MSAIKYYNRGIAISIIPVPARGTDEFRLVLAASTVHGPAGRAGLGRIGRINLRETCGLVSQHGLDLAPSGVQDGAVEPALLGDTAPRGLEGPARGSRHVLGAQPFDHNSAIAPGDVGGDFVRPVLAGARLPGPEGRDAPLRLRPPFRSTPSARGSALCLACRALVTLDFGRETVRCAVRKHQRHGHTTVDSRWLPHRAL